MSQPVALSELFSDINDEIRNSTTGSLDNNKRTRGINRILDDLQDYADWLPTKRTKKFYFIDGVTEYSLENYIGCTCQDVDGSTSILDFKNPYKLRVEDVVGTPFKHIEEGDVREVIRKSRGVNQYGVDQDLLLVNYPRQTSSQLHNCDSLTANGTVAASDDASNLTIDTVVYKEGSGALNFDVSSGTTLTITFTGIAAKDLTSLQNKAHLILKQWLPTITNFTSIRARWGSDASNYWEKTETQPAGNTALATDEPLIFAFRWADATETGSPDVTAVDYIQIQITYSSAVTDTDFRLDDIRIGKEVEMKLDYYSQAMVQDSAGDYQIRFNSTDVTQTDTLIGGYKMKSAVVEGSKWKIFQMVGPKRERDITDSLQTYINKREETLKSNGRRIKRESTQLNFPGRRGRTRDIL